MTASEDAPVLELETGDIAGGGGCVARDPDGRVVFVRHALPGERVRARITSTTSTYRRADAIEILRASSDRVTPPCPYSGWGRCGGCDFQHVALPAQRQLKAFRVREQLQRVAGIDHTVEVEPVAGDVEGMGWRTRIRLAVGPDGTVGFRQHRSHDVMPVTDCRIAHPAVMATGALGLRWPGARHVEVVTNGEQSVVDLDTVRAGPIELPEVRAGVVADGKVVRRPSALHSAVAGHTFRVTSGVFWQVHSGAATALSDTVAAVAAASPGDDVVDLYAGAGLFSVRLAELVGRHGSVLAIERDRQACADARHNGRDLAQLRVRRAAVTPDLIEHGIGRPDLLVLDPAREGAGTSVMGAVAAHHPSLRRLVYVSCDAGSFSRDIRVLLHSGWSLTSLRAFDIFPMTEHVELVAGLSPTA
jgi:tRNA/tmRNA/rRNA uracil-C5-methylase (TrmA/RlmC/RlmD family)